MIPMIELKSELEGIIKLEVIKEDGTLKEAEGLNVPFYNLITDAGGGAVLTYILQAIASMDFGNFTPIVVAVCDIALNALKEWMKGA